MFDRKLNCVSDLLLTGQLPPVCVCFAQDGIESIVDYCQPTQWNEVQDDRKIKSSLNSCKNMYVQFVQDQEL